MKKMLTIDELIDVSSNLLKGSNFEIDKKNVHLYLENGDSIRNYSTVFRNEILYPDRRLAGYLTIVEFEEPIFDEDGDIEEYKTLGYAVNLFAKYPGVDEVVDFANSYSNDY